MNFISNTYSRTYINIQISNFELYILGSPNEFITHTGFKIIYKKIYKRYI